MELDMPDHFFLTAAKLFYALETTVIKYSNVSWSLKKHKYPCCFAQAQSESSQLVV